MPEASRTPSSHEKPNGIPHGMIVHQRTFQNETMLPHTYAADGDLLAIVEENSMRIAANHPDNIEQLNAAGFSASTIIPNMPGGSEYRKWAQDQYAYMQEKRAENIGVPNIPGATLFTESAKRVKFLKVLTYSLIDKDGVVIEPGETGKAPEKLYFITIAPAQPNTYRPDDYHMYEAPYSETAESQLTTIGFHREAWHPGTQSVETIRGQQRRSWSKNLDPDSRAA